MRKRRGSVVDVLEATYRLDGTPHEWLAGIIENAGPSLDRGLGVVAFTSTLTRLLRSDFEGVASSTPDDPSAVMAAVNTSATPEMMALLTRRAWLFASMSETLAPLDEAGRGAFFEPASAHGVSDIVGLFAQDGGSGIFGFVAIADRRVTTSTAERAHWVRLASHFTAVARLRRRLDRLETAVLSADGRVVHAAGSARHADAREKLVRAARARERSRGPLRREAPDEALSLWRGLVDGRWSLVDRFDTDGSRWIVAYPNAPEVRDPRKLTAAERTVCHYAGLGASNKEIAYALGVSLSTVSTLLARTRRKLRLRRRSDFLTVAQLHDARVQHLELEGEHVALVEQELPAARGAVLAKLTAAERDLAHRLMTGATDAEIARARGTSVRTVSNQLARIYQKVGVENRVDLARMLGSR